MEPRCGVVKLNGLRRLVGSSTYWLAPVIELVLESVMGWGRDECLVRD